MACRACQKSLDLAPRLVSLRRGAHELQDYRNVFSAISLTPRRSNRTAPSTPARRSLHTSLVSRQKEMKSQAKSALGKLQGVLAGTTTTYLIYGASDKIYKACSAQAAYSISEQDRKDGKVTLGPDGEDVGVSGGGMWHKGTSPFPQFPLISCQPKLIKPYPKYQTSTSSRPSAPGRRSRCSTFTS